jgi:putative phosphonate metabolism protein
MAAEMTAVPRYAVYFAPEPTSDLWDFGSAAIGYDAATGRDVALVPPDGWSEGDWRSATEDPRRYGFHATLKAPFRLADGQDEAALLRALDDFATSHAAAPLGGLRVAALGRFIALVPAGDPGPIGALAFAAVTAFEPFRAPLSDADRARRLAGGGLSERQAALLEQFGYPYVAEQFRFHMTLSGPLPEAERDATRLALDRHFARLDSGVGTAVDRVALFRQDGPQERFRILAARPLGG